MIKLSINLKAKAAGDFNYAVTRLGESLMEMGIFEQYQEGVTGEYEQTIPMPIPGSDKTVEVTIKLQESKDGEG